MVWSILGALAIIIICAIPLIAVDVTGLSTLFLAWLFARGIGQFAETMERKGFDDPVYKKNLQRLIDRNRAFEEARKGKP